MNKEEAIDLLIKKYGGEKAQPVYEEIPNYEHFDYVYFFDKEKTLGIVFKIVDEKTEWYEITSLYSLCNEDRRIKLYPIVAFLKPVCNMNSYLAQNFNRACFYIDTEGYLIPFKIKNGVVRIGNKKITISDFDICDYHHFPSDKEWIEETNKNGTNYIESIYDFDKRIPHRCCILPKRIYESVEFEIIKNDKELMREYFYVGDMEKFFYGADRIASSFLRKKYPEYSYDDIEDFKQDVLLKLWEKIGSGELYHGNNIPSFICTICDYVIRGNKKKHAVRKKIIEQNPLYLTLMNEERKPLIDEAESRFCDKRKSKLPKIYMYDRNSNSLIKSYDSIREASLDSSISESSISRMLNGKIKKLRNNCYFSYNLL